MSPPVDKLVWAKHAFKNAYCSAFLNARPKPRCELSISRFTPEGRSLFSPLRTLPLIKIAWINLNHIKVILGWRREIYVICLSSTSAKSVFSELSKIFNSSFQWFPECFRILMKSLKLHIYMILCQSFWLETCDCFTGLSKDFSISLMLVPSCLCQEQHLIYHKSQTQFSHQIGEAQSWQWSLRVLWTNRVPAATVPLLVSDRGRGEGVDAVDRVRLTWFAVTTLKGKARRRLGWRPEVTNFLQLKLVYCGMSCLGESGQ